MSEEELKNRIVELEEELNNTKQSLESANKDKETLQADKERLLDYNNKLFGKLTAQNESQQTNHNQQELTDEEKEDQLVDEILKMIK